jgi:hypothetical protein
MKNVIIFISIMTIFLWLFATGNLPAIEPRDEKAVYNLNHRHPALSSITYTSSHSISEILRRLNMKIPLSHAERIAKMNDDFKGVYGKRLEGIRKIRAEVALLCDEILVDSKAK